MARPDKNQHYSILKTVPVLLKHLPFPKCSEFCRTVSRIGAGECENICPEKFSELPDAPEENHIVDVNK